MDTMDKKVFYFFFTLRWVYVAYIHLGIGYGCAYTHILYREQCAQYTNTLLLQYFITIRGPFSAKGFSAISINFIFGLPVTYVQQLYNLSQNLDIPSICLFYIITLVVYALKCMSSSWNILSRDRKYKIIENRVLVLIKINAKGYKIFYLKWG